MNVPFLPCVVDMNKKYECDICGKEQIGKDLIEWNEIHICKECNEMVHEEEK